MALGLRGLFERLIDDSTDNFGRIVTGELTDLIDVAGEKDFTPERIRYYKDGTRVYLEYGSDANYTETAAGHLIEPDSDQTLTITTAERAAYPVSLDLWPSVARRVTQAPQAGDVVGGGYGVIDLANFDPSAVDLSQANPASGAYSGTTADGYFWYHTAATGLDSVLLAGVRSGTVFDSFHTDLATSADVLSIIEQRLNCYDVGPSLFRETYTDSTDRTRPQQNDVLGSVSNDDGQGSEVFSQRVTQSVHQAAGNSGLGLEVGSMSVKASAEPAYKFKNKGHSMSFTVSATNTYQVVGAIGTDNTRPEVKVRLNAVEIAKTPGTGTNDTEVLVIAVDNDETDADESTFTVPPEHNPANSVVRVTEDNTLTGPVEDGAGTDSSGPDTANTMSDPGGYQIARETITTEGEGGASNIVRGQQGGPREIVDTDLALVLVNADNTGTCEVDFQTAQNS